jgi:hypothetical protein
MVYYYHIKDPGYFETRENLCFRHKDYYFGCVFLSPGNLRSFIYDCHKDKVFRCDSPTSNDVLRMIKDSVLEKIEPNELAFLCLKDLDQRNPE